MNESPVSGVTRVAAPFFPFAVLIGCLLVAALVYRAARFILDLRRYKQLRRLSAGPRKNRT